MEAGVRRICSSAELSGGASVRFDLPPERGRFGPVPVEGFAYRAADGAVRAFLNVCPHRAQPVDVGDGRLFNPAGELECPAHGARFDAATGACVGGPCDGRPLKRIVVQEREDSVWTAERSGEPAEE